MAKAIKIMGLEVYNKLPEYMRSASSLNIYKNK